MTIIDTSPRRPNQKKFNGESADRMLMNRFLNKQKDNLKVQ